MKNLALLLAALVSSASQAVIDDDYLFSMSLQELLLVEITGSTLTPESIDSVPSAVTVFNHRQITDMGIDTVDELLRFVPGFQSYRSHDVPIQSAYSVRGRRVAFFGAELLVLVDGQRLSEPNNSGGGRLLPKLSVKSIESIEFIRGPGSAVYGANAMAGVINIISRKAANEATLSYGTFNKRKGQILLSDALGPFNVDFYASHDSDDGDDYALYDKDSSSNIDTNDPQSLSELKASMKWGDNQLSLFHLQYEGDNFYEFGNVFNDYNASSTEFSALNFKRSFKLNSSDVEGYFWMGYRQSERLFKGRLAPAGGLAAISSPSSSEPLLVNGGFKDTNEQRYLLHTDWTLNDKQSWQNGIEYRKTDIPAQYSDVNYDLAALANGDFPIDSYGTDFQPTQLQSASQRDIFGLYSQYQHKLLDSTDLTLGLRYDKFSNIGENISPRVALIQQFSSEHTLKLLYGEAYRAPNEFELNLINNPVVLGNANLKPETVKSYDIIWLWRLPMMHISTSYFVNEFEDSILQKNQVGGSRQYVNDADEDPTKGLEVEVYSQVNDKLLVQANYSHILEKPDQMFREAQDFGSFIVNYQHLNWNINISASYNGEREIETASGMVGLDEYWLVYSKASYQYSSNLLVSLQAKNLMDENYESPTDGIDNPSGLPNRGQELLMSLRYSF